jgi:ribose transport system ATP-binding protein
MTPEAAMPLWELENITKIYPGVRANDGVSMTLYPGEIHGLLGENGSGKSTLIKILSGVHQPDSGSIRYLGQEVRLETPIAARRKGVATVFQEFSLVPTLTVAENIFLGQPLRRARLLLDWKRMRREAAEILNRLEIQIDPSRLVGELSVAEQQLVEVAKSIRQEAKMLILDEPTTALGEHEIQALHSLLRRMKSHGVAILYISHRLDEVVSLVDVVTILKDGKVVSTREPSSLDIATIVRKMVGREIKQHYPKEHNTSDDILLEVRGLNSLGGVRDVSFSVRRGEVFGLGGVIGAGRTEIARALFGVDHIVAGEILINQKKVDIRSPKSAIDAGIALVPENRKFDGLFFNFAGGPNISSAALKQITSMGLLQMRQEERVCRHFIDDLQISGRAASQLVGFLSGGNQQKVVIARWLFANSGVLLLDEPTQGIDIAAKVSVYKLINKLTAEGRAVILISSDHNELIAMSDRIGIVREGTIVEVRDARDVDQTHLVRASAADRIQPQAQGER